MINYSLLNLSIFLVAHFMIWMEPILFLLNLDGVIKQHLVRIATK